MATRSRETRRNTQRRKKPPAIPSTFALPPSSDSPPHGQNSNQQHLIPFANDPIRGPPLTIPKSDVDRLCDNQFLTTGFLDFLLQRAIPNDSLDPYMLLGSSNSMSYFQLMNSKTLDDVAASRLLQSKYRFYGLCTFRFIAANCSESHFSVISIIFDLSQENTFQSVSIYDSLRKSARRTDASLHQSPTGRLLRELQLFLVNFCMGDVCNNRNLTTDSDFILKHAKFMKCPQQQNGYDCGLFAFATVLHLVGNYENVEEAFSQKDVTKLRHSLYNVLSSNEIIDWDFMCSFFPRLESTKGPTTSAILQQPDGLSSSDNASSSGKDDSSFGNDNDSVTVDHESRPVAKQPEVSSVVVAHETVNVISSSDNTPHKDGDLEEPQGEIEEPFGELDEKEHNLHEQDSKLEEFEIKSMPSIHSDADDDEDWVLDPSAQDLSDRESDDNKTTSPIDGPAASAVQINNNSKEDVQDTFFMEFFTKKKFQHLDELDVQIFDYEVATGIRLVIQKSSHISRQYKCGSHRCCPFRAKFGRKRFSDHIILKTTYTKAVHPPNPIPYMPKGRLPKKQLKGKMDAAIDDVSKIKDQKPVAKDVMKAAAKIHGIDATYNQAYRAVRRVSTKRWEEDKISFQMIIPYLKKFVELNPGSKIDYHKDNQQCITRLYMCPGIMNLTIMNVRPVMSLDACHLKSEWKGILYVASVKTACDRLYPVAIGITQDNENESGWIWFLGLLRSSIDCLVNDYPHGRSQYKYFSFVSDRQKGLIQALTRILPESMSAQMLEEIEKISSRARTYLVQEIPPEHWRETAWLDDPGLPPRYGITTSNISESTNNMFEKARDKSWLFMMHTIILSMMERITTLRNRVKGREGVVM